MKDHQLPLPQLSEPFSIGSVTIRNRAVLAPMSGVTDLPFRQLAWRYGAGLVVTEMVASRELVANRGESWARLKNAGMVPHMVQLAGREAHFMAEAAKIAADNGAGIIDINMGCPAKKVTGGYSGSALMRDPDHALSLIEATVKAVDVPVTLKMRLGWDENTINAPEIARRAEAAGVQLITIHGRTRMQFYEGRADWNAIRAVREVISVPLIANGDIETAEDAREILRRSDADAVMVGRGAQGQPWLPAVLAGHAAPQHAEIAGIAVEHYEMMLEFYGREAGLRHARKHLGWYLDRFAIESVTPDKAKIMTSRDTGEVADLLRSALSENAGEDAARKAA
ncbi:tRNA-dihydrouridine synthase B [Rhizobium rhizogenes]|uniref:tRNA-dihydrouridine synthase n=1 Tax=Rhizobium rhizogenes TaxID=359 RepID=A0AAN2A1B8_RHIRH|nr:MULTISPECIES: tRNA dihydrouridine synthase DusB [Rhizobium/Agrobacterium group]AQS61915.1 tRNA dihydrouridine synthase DusB [Rhizobium rhizogenes]MCZ7442848.1 tRNA dihydrouridine synthase DusB [Rhizobium rhizogenes]NSZ78838.1 tRNA dihydrouridine synthase DusB [Agrobacterium tumefaciens]OAM65641.1 tRNA-dihydrouridine synthase [Rhizobium rhizogenes]CAD0211052.1 tRNA-dihydrouridine synthase B [Rhizobium rhizogenes]